MVLASTARHCLSLCGEAGVTVPVSRPRRGFGVSAEYRKNGDLNASPRFAGDRRAEGKDGVVEMRGEHDHSPAELDRIQVRGGGVWNTTIQCCPKTRNSDKLDDRRHGRGSARYS